MYRLLNIEYIFLCSLMSSGYVICAEKNHHQDDGIKTYEMKRMFNLRDNEGNTPAHVMAMQCRDSYYDNPENIAEMIVALDKGSFNPFIENNNGKTPRNEAASRDCPMMAKMLLEYEEAYKLYYQNRTKTK